MRFSICVVSALTVTVASATVLTVDDSARIGFGNDNPPQLFVDLSARFSDHVALGDPPPPSNAHYAIDGSSANHALLPFKPDDQSTTDQAYLDIRLSRPSTMLQFGFRQTGDVVDFRIEVRGIRNNQIWKTRVTYPDPPATVIFEPPYDVANGTQQVLEDVYKIIIVPLNISSGSGGAELRVVEFQAAGWEHSLGTADEAAVGAVRLENDAAAVIMGVNQDVILSQTPSGSLVTPNSLIIRDVDILAALRSLESRVSAGPALQHFPIYVASSSNSVDLEISQSQATPIDVPNRSLTFTKLRNDTWLRLHLQDSFGVHSGDGSHACEWRIQIDGQDCPSGVVRMIQYKNIASTWWLGSNNLAGFCGSIDAGAHVARVNMRHHASYPPNHASDICRTGWNGFFSLEIQEIDASLVNVVGGL